MIGRVDVIAALLCALLLSLPASAKRIDPDRVSVIHGRTGQQIVEHHEWAVRLFNFSPLVVYKPVEIPGFSDPLGTGVDPLFRVFSGNVRNMDLLGDFYPYNPYDPDEVKPTQDSMKASMMVSYLLYGNPMPTKDELVDSRMRVAYASLSEFSSLPQTKETLPLSLAGFGSVSELATPAHLHWTHCPDYTFKRYLFERSDDKTSGVKRSQRPPNDCFII